MSAKLPSLLGSLILLAPLAGSAATESPAPSASQATAARLLGSYDLLQQREGGDLVLLDARAIYRLRAGSLTPVSAGAPFGLLTSIVEDAFTGDFLVTDALEAAVFRVTADGKVSLLHQGAPLASPVGIAQDTRTGDLLIADRGARAVFRMDGAGQPRVLAQGAPLVRPIDLSLDPATGDVLVLDEAPAIHRVSPAGAIRTLSAGAPLVAPARIELDPATGRFLVTDRAEGAVFEVAPSGAVSLLARGTGFEPIGISHDASTGGFLVGDQSDSSVRSLDAHGKLDDGGNGAAFAPGGEVLEQIFSHQFDDVPTSHPYHGFISDFVDLGITAGCSLSPALFCPDNPVTRGQAAVFFVRTYKLLTVGSTSGALMNPPAYRAELTGLAPNVIAGDAGNQAQPGVIGGAIGGGEGSMVTDAFGVVAGGGQNVAGNADGDTTNAGWSTVAGGHLNRAMGKFSGVSGGEENRASGGWSSVGGGSSNTANGMQATVGGGDSNQAYGMLSTIPGGSGNIAVGDYSFAAGFGAQAQHDGSFVWGDSVVTEPIISTAPDQFLVRAHGGVGINTDRPNAALTVAGGVALSETGAQAPTSGYGKFYVNSADGDPYFLSSGGVATNLLSGSLGPTGPSGPAGATGVDGPVGPTGVAGATGAPGANGLDGATGPSGAAGATGATGAIGPQGLKGLLDRPSHYLGTVDNSASDVGQYAALVIGADGLAIISYYDATNGDLKTAHCENIACTSSTVTAHPSGDDYGKFSSIAVRTSGLPIVFSYNDTQNGIAISACADLACTSVTTTTMVSGALDIGQYLSLDIASNGNPIASFYEASGGDLGVLYCTDPDCATSTVQPVDSSANDVGRYSSLVIGVDGFPQIAYHDATAGDLKLVHCTAANCTTSDLPVSLETTGTVGLFASISIGEDKIPLVIHHDSVIGAVRRCKCNAAVCTACSTTMNNQIDTGAGAGVSLTHANDARALVVYAVTGGGLRALHCGATTCSAAGGNTISIVDSGSVGTFPATALGMDGNPITAYYDSGNGDLKVVHFSNRWGVPYLRTR